MVTNVGSCAWAIVGNVDFYMVLALSDIINTYIKQKFVS